MRSFWTSWSQSSWAPASSSRPSGQIAFDVDIEEGRDAADRHRRAIGLLDGAEIGEIGPLHRFLGVGRRAADVAVVELRHRHEVFERPHLLGEFFALANDLVGRPHVVDLGALGFLDLEQAIDAVERDTAVVADDAAAAVGVGQAGNDAGPAALHDFRRVGVEHAVIVGLAVLGEGLVHLRVGRKAGRLQPGLDHAQSAVRKDGALERFVGLQPDDHLVVLVDIAGLVSQHGRWVARIDGKHALFSFLFEIGLQFLPDGAGPLGRPFQEFFIAGIWSDIAGDKVANIDRLAPTAALEVTPRLLNFRGLGDSRCAFHRTSPR